MSSLPAEHVVTVRERSRSRAVTAMRATIARMRSTAAEYRSMVEQTRSTVNAAQVLILQMDALQRALVPRQLLDVNQTGALDDRVAFRGRQRAALMAIYFLNVRDRGELIRDPDGSCLPDLRAARTEAIVSARELMAQSIATSGRIGIDRSVEISDAKGATLLVVPFWEAATA